MNKSETKPVIPPVSHSAVLTYEEWKHNFLRVVLRSSSILFLVAVLFAFSSNTLANNILYLFLVVILAVTGFAPLPYSVRAFVLLLILFIGATNLLLIWGIEGEASMVYLGVIALTALLYEKRQEFITLVLAVSVISFVAARTLNGEHILSGWTSLGAEFYTAMVATWTAWITYIVDLVAVGLILIFAIRLLKGQFNKILQEARTSLNEITLAGSQLEERVSVRTSELDAANRQTSRRASQLQAITILSQTIAQLQDLNEILPAATKLISESFNFYHVGIFLIDNEREYAFLQAANSEGGKLMLERNHKLRLGTGVVGYAAQTGNPRIALDVGTDAVFFDNPDLPDTRSEAALPMKSHGETIGILDVQSLESGAFTHEDLQTLSTLANQVAIALENARLLTETRSALRQVQEVYDEFTRAEWNRTISKAEQPGFRYRAGRIEMMEKTQPAPEVVEAVHRGEIITGSVNGSEEKRSTVAVPVKVRGEVIGVIHVESNSPAKFWLEDEVSLIEAVAERAAFAMENARLFQDARRRAVKEQSISEATARISSAMNMENILHTTAEELERILGVPEVSIRFQDKE